MDQPKPPEDIELLNIIDKFAQFVARNGPEFEQMTKSKQADNPKFRFLFGGEHYSYYQYRVATERSAMMQGSGPEQHHYGPPPMPHLRPPQAAAGGYYPPMSPHHGPPMLQPQSSPGPRFGGGGGGPPPPNHLHHPGMKMAHGQYGPPPPMQPGPHHPMSHAHPNDHTPPFGNNVTSGGHPRFPPVGQAGPPNVPFPAAPMYHQNNASFNAVSGPPPLPNGPPQPAFNHSWCPPYQAPPQLQPYPQAHHPPQPQPQPIQPNQPQHQQQPLAQPVYESSNVNHAPPEQLNPEQLALIEKLREEISDSEKNLTNQRPLIMEEEKERRIDEMITKSLDDELKRMCEDYAINLNEFDKILQPIIEQCRKESVANGKAWIFNNCTDVEHFEAVAKHILKSHKDRFDIRGEVTFDVFDQRSLQPLVCQLLALSSGLEWFDYNHSITIMLSRRKDDERLRTALNSIIVPAFATVDLEATTADRKQHITKLFNLWEAKQYLDNSYLDQLKKPQESLDAYKTSLSERFADQIGKIFSEQIAKFDELEKQHNELVRKNEERIEEIQRQQRQPTQQSFHQPVAAQPPFMSMPPNSMYLGTGPPQVRPMQMGPQLHPAPPVSNSAAPLLPFVTSTGAHGQPPPPQVAPLPGYAHQQPSHGFFPNSSAPNTPVTGPYAPPVSGPGLMPLTVTPGTLQPAQAQTPPFSGSDEMHSSYQEQNLPEPTAKLPYFDMPAGIMTQHIDLEDFDYKSIDPNEMRIPVVTPPSDQLLKALDAFYAAPSHEHPRNAEGWEKLGLYEFFKAKSQARKEYEANMAIQQSATDNNENETNGKENDKSKRKQSLSPPKRRYKEFKEEKDLSSSNNKHKSRRSRSRSRSKSRERSRHRSSRRSRSKSRSRSPSRSPRRRPSPSRSSRQSRSKSPASAKSSSRSTRPALRRSPSRSPPSTVPDFVFTPTTTTKVDTQTPLDEFNKGHQLLKKMGWSGAGGLGSKEHGIQDPISAGDVRDKSNQYRGIGTPLTTNDPYESYRRNKGQAYIQRIRDARQ